MSTEGLRNSDALALIAQSTVPLPYTQINPYAFAPAIAPHIAAQEAGVELSVAGLYRAAQVILQEQADFILIEGAGGWRVPISATEFLSDFAIALQFGAVDKVHHVRRLFQYPGVAQVAQLVLVVVVALLNLAVHLC